MDNTEKINLLRTDILGRSSQDGYVKASKDGRLNWEYTLPKGSSYSAFAIDKKDIRSYFKNAIMLAADMVKVMNLPKSVEIAANPGNSMTDGRTIYLATDVFDDKKISDGQKLDIFIGLAVHEAAHCLHTNHGKEEYAIKRRMCKVARNIYNIIEDERIEMKVFESMPGLSNFVKMTKYYYFNVGAKQIDESQLDDIAKLHNLILAYIRYPDAINDASLNKFADEMLQVRRILTPYPTSTIESLLAGEKIYKLIEKYAEKQQEQEKKQQEKQQQQDGQSGQSGQKARSGQDKQDNQECKSAIDRVRDSVYGENEERRGAIESMCGDIVNDRHVSKDVKRICETSRREYNELSSRNASQKSGVNMRKDEIGPMTETKYKYSLERVRQYIPALRNSFVVQSTEYKFALHGCRSGILDTSKIAEAYQAVPDVYIREGEVRHDRIAVCMLIDESGSMFGNGELYARDAAVLINESLRGVNNVDLYIYGHTHSRDRGTLLKIYREKDYAPRFALGNTDSLAGNRDSVAITTAAERVRQFTDAKCLFFMVSDGAPNEAPELVKEAVGKVQRNGFEVVAVSIDPYYDPKTMYDNNVVFKNIATLAPELGKMIRKAVEKNSKKNIRY